LYQNVPNPFNPATQIQFDLAQRENVRVSVYDVSGRLVSTLFEGELGSGPHSIPWDGTAADGARVASGVYFYVLRTDAGEVAKRRMVLLK
jgi:flagellar hook assembly protein FlgD